MAFFIWFAYHLKNVFDVKEKLGANYGHILLFWMFKSKQDVPKEDFEVIRVYARKFYRSLAILVGFIILLIVIRSKL